MKPTIWDVTYIPNGDISARLTDALLSPRNFAHVYGTKTPEGYVWDANILKAGIELKNTTITKIRETFNQYNLEPPPTEETFNALKSV